MSPTAPRCVQLPGGPPCTVAEPGAPGTPSVTVTGSAAAQPPAPGAPQEGTGSLAGTAVWLGVVLLAAAVLVGVLAAVHQMSGRRGDSTRTAAPSGAVPEEAASLIRAHDLATTEDERAEVARRLHACGVVPVQVRPGDPLDPRVHNVVEGWPAGGGAVPRTVASVARPGWVTGTAGGDVVRPADVCVWV
jgi:hypothetical protein